MNSKRPRRVAAIRFDAFMSLSSLRLRWAHVSSSARTRADHQIFLSLPPGTLARVFLASRGRRSAGTAQVSMGTSCEGARLPSDRQARLPALHRGDFGHDHRTFFIGPDALGVPLSRQHLRCPSSDVVQPLKAGPSSGPDGDRASWDEGANLACRRRLPAPPPNASGRRPQ